MLRKFRDERSRFGFSRVGLSNAVDTFEFERNIIYVCFAYFELRNHEILQNCFRIFERFVPFLIRSIKEIQVVAATVTFQLNCSVLFIYAACLVNDSHLSRARR